MITAAQAHDTNLGPLKEWMADAQSLERRADVAQVAIFASQPWLDVPGLGWYVVATAYEELDPRANAVGGMASDLARAIWADREAFRIDDMTSMAAALETVTQSPVAPWILADGADSPSAGASGDGTDLLCALCSGTSEGGRS